MLEENISEREQGQIIKVPLQLKKMHFSSRGRSREKNGGESNKPATTLNMG